VFDAKTAVLECFSGVASEMAAAGEQRPHGYVGCSLQDSAKRLSRGNVFIESKFAAAPDNAV
jgi:hypothetical protein